MTTTISSTDPLIATKGGHFESPEGGELFERDAKGELFIAAVSTTAGDAAYEGADNRDLRIRALVRQVGAKDPGWVLRFVRWAREEGNLRRVPGMVTAELVHDRLTRGVKDETGPNSPGLNRVAINVCCSRADEPSLLLELWEATYGKPFPQPLKRGLADACARLYSERSALKYDTPRLKYRFGDVVEICHPTPRDDVQGALFEWLLDRRHGRKDSSGVLPSLPRVTANTHVRSLMDTEASRAMIREQLLENPGDLEIAGMTWENLSSLGPMDKDAWEAVIPAMGYMALLRNLRNFDEAGISVPTTDLVKSRLVDADAVEKSRQFPFRFFSAYLNSNTHWHETLETALTLSLRNVPALSGRTLTLVDCSGSMYGWNERGPNNAQKAALFGTALAMRSEDSTLVAYGSSSLIVKPRRGVLATMDKFQSMGATYTTQTLQEHWDASGPYDRVIILTDEQLSGGGAPGSVIPASVPLYTWNLGGHFGAQTMATSTRHSFGGLTDQGFAMIPMIESVGSYTWPF